MICIDPTEARDNTRLPDDLIHLAQGVENLERLTGADILISCSEGTAPSILSDIPPHRAWLQYHCAEGLLVQRKSGGDFLSSIPDLDKIQARMSEWAGNPFLLITRLKKTAAGMAGISGSRHRYRWDWASVMGAMNAWRLRGGSVLRLEIDEEITETILALERKVTEYHAGPDKQVSHKHALQKVKRKDANWFNTLSLCPPNIGQKKMARVAQAVDIEGDEPSAVNVIAYATSNKVLQINGWGTKMLSDMRDWWGISGVTRVDRSLTHSITFLWPELPCIPSGEGVTVEHTDEGVRVTFTDYEQMRSFALILGAAQGQGHEVYRHSLGTGDDPNPLPKGARVKKGK